MSRQDAGREQAAEGVDERVRVGDASCVWSWYALNDMVGYAAEAWVGRSVGECRSVGWIRVVGCMWGDSKRCGLYITCHSNVANLSGASRGCPLVTTTPRMDAEMHDVCVCACVRVCVYAYVCLCVCMSLCVCVCPGGSSIMSGKVSQDASRANI